MNLVAGDVDHAGSCKADQLPSCRVIFVLELAVGHAFHKF